MKAIKLALLIVIVIPCRLKASDSDSSKNYFLQARQRLESMLAGKERMSYEEAIYQIENAWWDGAIDYAAFKNDIDHHAFHIREIAASNVEDKKLHPLTDLTGTKEQKLERYRASLVNFAIYKYMTSQTLWEENSGVVSQKPYKYSVKDPMGTMDWTNTHVTHLLNEKSGNCFALASLFRIFSERLNSDARLCTAPSHIYIRHADEKGTDYNVELSSRSFPGTGTIETLTYTPTEATKNGIALRELDLKQSIALCLVYLAKGYEHKFGTKDDEFMLACAETALKYDDHNLNAMLLKAEVLENRLTKNGKDIKQLQSQQEFKDYEQWVAHIYKLGYREMPFEMKNILIKGWTKDTVIQLEAQDHTPSRTTNPNITPTRYASLSWGLFDEEIRTKPLERYGNTVFDTKKQKIVAFLDDDILYNQYNFDPVVFAWNVDPLAHKFPWQSPYSAFDNNPIWKNDPTGAAGEITASGNTLTIYSTMIFYGGAANAKLANVATTNIQNQWNAATGSVEFNGKTYTDIKFVVTAKVVSEQQAKNMAAMNKGDNFDPRLNFARIENTSPTKANEFAAQMGTGKGDNSFFFSTRDLDPGNTSQSHEYGHGLGGDHNPMRTFVDGIPNIMSTLYNGVDGAYSVDGQKSEFVGNERIPLHRMNQNCRQVQQTDLDQIYIHDYKGGIGSGSQAGSSSNILYDENGSTVGGNATTITR